MTAQAFARGIQIKELLAVTAQHPERLVDVLGKLAEMLLGALSLRDVESDQDRRMVGEGKARPARFEELALARAHLEIAPAAVGPADELPRELALRLVGKQLREDVGPR